LRTLREFIHVSLFFSFDNNQRQSLITNHKIRLNLTTLTPKLSTKGNDVSTMKLRKEWTKKTRSQDRKL